MDAGVFINVGCRFQDQGGIYIGDGALICHNCVIATLNHDMGVTEWCHANKVSDSTVFK